MKTVGLRHIKFGETFTCFGNICGGFSSGKSTNTKKLTEVYEDKNRNVNTKTAELKKMCIFSLND